MTQKGQSPLCHWLLIEYLLGLQYGAEGIRRNAGYEPDATADFLEIVDIERVAIRELEPVGLGHLLRGSRQGLCGLVLEPLLFEEYPECLV